MFISFYFDNESHALVEKKILELLDENDISENAVVFCNVPKFFVMASNSVDEGLAVKLIREFDWSSIGVEIPVEIKNDGLCGNVVVLEMHKFLEKLEQ